jgi:hypothetical protein
VRGKKYTGTNVYKKGNPIQLILDELKKNGYKNI